MDLSRLVRAFLLVSVISLIFPAAPTQAASAPGASAWTYSSLSYRREVTLPAATRSRTNVPVWVDLRPLGNIDLASIKVEEITGSSPVAITAAAYAQPAKGREPRAFWVAPGTTAINATRRFLLYYNHSSSAPKYTFNYNRSGCTFGTYKVEVEAMNGGTKYYYNLRGDKADFMRGARTYASGVDSSHACFYEQGSEFYRFKDPASAFSPLNGIRMTYAFMGAPFTEAFYFFVSGAQRSFDAILTDRNGPTAAFSAHYSISDQVAHQTEVTHRIFQNQPLLEYTVTTTPNSGSLLDWDNAIFHSRQFYWPSSITPTRMITDLGYDGAPNSDGCSENYLILGAADGNGFGVFSFKPGPKRRQSSTRTIQDYYATSSDKGSVVLYYAAGNTDQIKYLFQTMKRGYPVGLEQQQKFSVMQPAPSQHFVNGESVSVVVAGPSLGSDASLKVEFPGGTSQTYSPATNSGGCATFNLGTINSKFGTWKMIASSGGATRTRNIDVANPDHPRLVFTKGELTAIRNRWKTDPRYKNHIQHRLIMNADSALNAPAVPASITCGPREYGRKLMYLAGALLMDPSQSQYRSRMWADFRTMMTWKQWDPITNGVEYFENDDVERGEVLHQLATVYDWFYGDLTIAEKRNYAELFARYADSLMACDYATLLHPRWNTYNSINNSRSIGQCAAIAAVDRLVEDEIQGDRHTAWKTRLDAYWSNLMATLSSDGAYNAGQSYHALLLWAVQVWSETRRLNTGDTSLYNTNWYKNMPSYVLYGMMPGRVGNFGGLMPFGNTERSPYYSMQADLALPGLRASNPVAEWVSEYIDYERVEPLQAAWQDYSKPKVAPACQPNWHLFDKKGIFVYRSDWSDQAMYFAGKCGEYWGGHEHPDTGTFVIHRNGYPYIAAPLYLKKVGTEDENIMAVNGMLPRGRVDGAYSDPTEPAYWGKTLVSLGSPNYFNLLQNPQPCYEEGSNLTFYNREYVGIRDIIVLRDSMKASTASTFKLMLHGYKTAPQTVASSPYDPDQYPSTIPFQQTSQNNRIRLYPNQTMSPGESMAIYNVSRNAWTTTIGAWKLATKYIPETLGEDDDRRSNNSGNVYSRGGQLTRTISGVSEASALQVFSFRDDNTNVRAWSTSLSDDGVVVYAGATSNARLKVVWPKGGKMTNVSGAEGLTVTGTMAMRNYDNKEFGGRSLTLLRDDSAQGEKNVLMSSNVPITFASRTAGGVGSAYIACSNSAKVTLYCSQTVRGAWFNNQPITWSGVKPVYQFNIPAAPNGGQLVLNFHSNSTEDWAIYK